MCLVICKTVTRSIGDGRRITAVTEAGMAIGLVESEAELAKMLVGYWAVCGCSIVKCCQRGYQWRSWYHCL